jgi:hypothetical protein
MPRSKKPLAVHSLVDCSVLGNRWRRIASIFMGITSFLPKSGDEDIGATIAQTNVACNRARKNLCHILMFAGKLHLGYNDVSRLERQRKRRNYDLPDRRRVQWEPRRCWRPMKQQIIVKQNMTRQNYESAWWGYIYDQMMTEGCCWTSNWPTPKR